VKFVPALSVLLLTGIGALHAASDKPAKPAKPVAPAKPTATSPTSPAVAGKPEKIDFKIPLTPYKQKDLIFSMFAKRNAVLFYYSPNCGHCQHTYPVIQKLRDTYEKKGVAFVTIATGYASAEDLSLFDQDFRLDMPSFHDKTKKFGELYGTGSVPQLFVVSPNGKYKSWNSSSQPALDSLEATLKANLKAK
jgi:thiol-disulfide isomerase/thioredoxin